MESRRTRSGSSATVNPPSIESCIDRAAEMGFDGVEILHVQMGEDQSNARLQKLKQQAFRHGLDLCGFSTHQSFVKLDPADRQKNIDHTIRCIELAYALGIRRSGEHRTMGHDQGLR